MSNQYCGVVPNEGSDLGDDMYWGATATGLECVPVPTSAIAGGGRRVTDDRIASTFAFVRAS